MLRLKKACYGFHTVSGTRRAACWLLLTFFLGSASANGNDLNAPDTAGDVGRFTSMALNDQGHPVVGYHDLTNRDLKLLRCDDPYCQEDESANISNPDTQGMVGTYTSLALDAAGNPIVSYYDASDGNLKLLHCDDSACSSSSTSTPDAAGVVGMHTSLALDANGNPVISYYDDANGDLKLLHCDDEGCTGDEYGNISTPDTEGDVGLYTSLALDAAGNPVISYYAANVGLKIVHCDDAGCKGDESKNIAVIDKGEVGWFSSLALDAVGNPVISYYNFSTGDLKILHCDDAFCSGDESKNITTPDTSDDVGRYISMVLDAKGYPVVSYHDASRGKLKILHCDDPQCSGDETSNINTLTFTTGDAGLYTSIALDASGNPVVSYYDAEKGDLNILHCTNHTCKTTKR